MIFFYAECFFPHSMSDLLNTNIVPFINLHVYQCNDSLIKVYRSLKSCLFIKASCSLRSIFLILKITFICLFVHWFNRSIIRLSVDSLIFSLTPKRKRIVFSVFGCYLFSSLSKQFVFVFRLAHFSVWLHAAHSPWIYMY